LAKSKTAYVCNECGSEYAKWQGQCNDCREWNTLTRISISPNVSANAPAAVDAEIRSLQDVDLQNTPRLVTGVSEFDRVLGGGFVPGSAILIGGHPGAGKSTLLLQIMCAMAGRHTALYVTGEESLQQVAGRANRLNLPLEDLKVMVQTNVDVICRKAEQLQPKLMVVDSIQVMYREDLDSSPGGVLQVKESASWLIRFAKLSNTVLLLVGHVTKDGSLAGPKILEHMIDCFIMLEGESDSRYRTLRVSKNRFGAVNELGVFAMTDQGMKEVKNPSAIFLNRTDQEVPGSLVMVVWEGTRPLLVEAQALVDQNSLGNPRRVVVGFEQNRLAMLLAVLHKHAGLEVGDQDVFINVVGGIQVTETSSDLAFLLAMVSSFTNKPLPRDLVVFGEVGLSGEVRPVPNGQERLQEAAKHGFHRAIIPEGNLPRKEIGNMSLVGVRGLSQALEAVG
jgi:DNA repair protein RadA/Sms